MESIVLLWFPSSNLFRNATNVLNKVIRLIAACYVLIITHDLKWTDYFLQCAAPEDICPSTGQQLFLRQGQTRMQWGQWDQQK